MADEATKLEEDAMKVADATTKDVADAVQAGANVAVKLAEGTTAVSFEGKQFIANEAGIVMLHIRNALHAVEAFGAKIVTLVEEEVQAVAAKAAAATSKKSK